MLATQYAKHHKLDEQRDGESDNDFKQRVAQYLRENGYIIEAHEVSQDKLYNDEDSDAMTGIIGAVAQAMQGTQYQGDQIGNDIAAGVVAMNQKEKMSPEEVLLFTMLFG